MPSHQSERDLEEAPKGQPAGSQGSPRPKRVIGDEKKT